MYSTDGISWNTSSAANSNFWMSVTVGNNMFAAVSNSGSSNQIMTSTDGITWTVRTTPNNNWRCICYGSGTYVVVGITGTGN